MGRVLIPSRFVVRIGARIYAAIRHGAPSHPRRLYLGRLPRGAGVTERLVDSGGRTIGREPSPRRRHRLDRARIAARRANGLAYARWKQGHVEEAASWAREAAQHAGDVGTFAYG